MNGYIKSLYRRGWDREQILALFHFIDWLLRLPDGLENRLWDEIQKYEQEDKMPYISSVEKIGLQKGEQIGFQKGERTGFQKGERVGTEKGAHKGYVAAIELGLSLKFGDSALSLMPAVKRIGDPDRLLMIVEAIKVAKGLDEIRQLVIGPDGRA